MPRIRYIKPDFFTDEDLGQLSPLTRIAFEGLWCYADKEGRLKDRPQKLKIEILPYDDCNFDEILNILAKPKPINNHSCFITRYEVNGEKYIQINKFKDHQKPHHTEKDSLIPLPLTVKKPLRNREKREGMGIEKGMEKGMENVYSASFLSFYKEYPKKEGKLKAMQAWKALNPSHELIEIIMVALQKHKQLDRWLKDNGQFIPLPATWLNGKRWEDEFEAKKPTSKYSSAALNMIEKLREEKTNEQL